MTPPSPGLARVLALAGALLAPGAALAAETDPRQAGVAQALYDEAIPAMRAGDFASACPKLEKVVELAPTGIGAKLMLAECYEGQGRLASAWTMYAAVEAAAASAGQAERQKKARDRAHELKPSLAVLTVVVPDAVAAVPGLSILCDGHPVKPVEWGLPLPADRGKHTLIAAAPGRQRWEKTVEIPADGARVSVQIDPLSEQESPVDAPPPRWFARRVAGLGVGFAGLVAVGVGSAFGAMAIAKKNQSNDGHCRPDNHCDPTGLMLRDDGMRSAAVSTGLFIAGAPLLVAGVTLVAIPHRASAAEKAAPRTEARLTAGPGSIRLEGTW